MRVLRLLAALLALAVLAACGSDGGGGGGGEEAASQPVTVTDSRGQHQLPAPASRVVALEWGLLENLLTLGLPPVGAADIANYRSYVSAGPDVPPQTQDVGTRQQPNLEAIAALQPDLIVATSNRVTDILERLQQIAPVLVFDPYRDPNQYVAMREDFTQLGIAVGKQDAADNVLGELDGTVEAGRQALADAGRAGARVVYSQAYSSGPAVVFRIFDQTSIPGALVDDLGLTPGAPGGPSDFGYTELGIEGLFSLGDSWLLYSAPPTDTAFADALRQPGFQALPTVQAGRAVALDPGVWFFGGPRSTQALVNETVRALGGQPPA